MNFFHCYCYDRFSLLQDTTVRRRLRKCIIREYFYGRPQSPLSIVFSPERREGLQLSSFVFLRVGGIQLTQVSIHSQLFFYVLLTITRRLIIHCVLLCMRSVLPKGMRIVGESSHQDACKLTRFAPTTELVNSIVAVLHGPPSDTTTSTSTTTTDSLQGLLASNVAGFLSIVQLDTDNDRMTVLSPSPGALPSNFLLVGSIKWVE